MNMTVNTETETQSLNLQVNTGRKLAHQEAGEEEEEEGDRTENKRKTHVCKHNPTYACADSEHWVGRRSGFKPAFHLFSYKAFIYFFAIILHYTSTHYTKCYKSQVIHLPSVDGSRNPLSSFTSILLLQ